MSNQVVVHKGRTNMLQVNLGFDVSSSPASHITSQIRSQPSQSAPLLAEWVVSYLTDGSDGKLVLTLSDTITAQIDATSGFMDLKREVAGQAMAVFDGPLEVLFKGTVTE